MKISATAIDQPRTVYMATILVVLLAGFAAAYTSVQLAPAITKAVVLVAVPYPGAQPTEVEEQITRKIEDELQNLKNVDFIASTSQRGSSVTQVIFLDGVEPDAARGEVKDLIDRIRSQLPLGREVQPVVTDIDFDNTPLMLVNILGPEGFDERSLNRLAEEIQDELEVVPGVASTQLFGGREREFQVDIYVDLAVQYGLTIGDFRRALLEFHSELPGGELETGQYDFRVRSATKLRTIEDIRSVVLREEEGRVLRLSDVAEVRDSYRRLRNVAYLDGRDTATIIVYKETDINTLATAQAIKQRVRELDEQYPFLRFSVTRDTSQEIFLMFRVLGSSFIFGAMVVLLILGWTMGLRIALLVLIAIPMSSAIGLIFLFFSGIPVSNMVIFSFILVLGMVVDGAIIVAENIHRHLERGEDPVTAAKVGIEEVGWPVIFADLTTVAAYLPMLLVPGIMGDFMGVMPKVVSVSLLGSVLVDHFLIPVLAAQWFKRRAAKSPPAGANGRHGVLPDSEHIRPHLGWFTRSYAAVLGWALRQRWAVVACAALAVAWAVVTLGNIGFDFFPKSDRGQFEVRYEMPLGTSIDRTIAASQVITEPLEVLRREGLVVHFVSALGSSEGLASRLENDPATGPEFGTVMVQLLSPLDRDVHQNEIIQRVREGIEARVGRFPGMKYSIEEVTDGPPGGADVAIRFTGIQHEQLGRVAKQVTERLKQVPNTLDVADDYRDENPEIVVDPRREVLPLLGLTDSQVAQAVQTAILGDTTIELSIDDEDVTLRLQAAPEYRRTRTSLADLPLISPAGRRATIGQVAELRREMGLYSINRYERKRAVVSRCNITKGTRSDAVFAELRDRILPELGFEPVPAEDLSLPGQAMTWLRENYLGGPPPMAVNFLGRPGTAVEGVRAAFTGQNEERDKNFGYLLWSMLLAVIGIFAILVLMFNSFRQPVIVMLSVPLSFVGVVAGMWLGNFPFSLASFIGLVSLTGVVVNDAIVVVDFINQSRQRGTAMFEAILEAGINRLRPVLLTTATTVGGLLPLMLNWSGGAEFWQPLCASIVYGLIFATVLTLVVVPVAYSMLYNREFIASRPE